MIRIANAGGFWGDDPHALRAQVEGGDIDYVTIDFLAEITMSIMQKQRARDPERGYAHDFIGQLEEVLPALLERNIRVISNAGGVNPMGCARAIQAMARAQGLNPKIAVVDGDDLMDRIDDLRGQGVSFANMETGEDFAVVRDRVVSANAYFGAAPVVRALAGGAQIVVTGRCTDTGITLAPMIHEFGWTHDDLDRLALGTVAGHIIECGTQATGGNFTDWTSLPSLGRVGYPIVEVSPDASFVVTKHPGTDGEVSIATVSEQLVYEMGVPTEYITPDVVADFTAFQLTREGPDRVRVTGGRGDPPPPTLKVSMSYQDGWKASGAIVVCAPGAVAKARAAADIFWGRLSPRFEATLAELVGYSACHGPPSPDQDPDEVLLRLSVRDHDRDSVREFSRMVASLILSGPPGLAATGGRPPVQEVVAYWPALVPREAVIPRVVLLDGESEEEVHPEWPAIPEPAASPNGSGPAAAAPPRPTPAGRTRTVPLQRLCHGRSGDKGDTCNIGVIARSDAAYAFILEHLTADRVKERFGGICLGDVERHAVPNLRALNFLMHESLGGGGTVSLRMDPQGKTLAHALLRMPVTVDEAILETCPAGTDD